MMEDQPSVTCLIVTAADDVAVALEHTSRTKQ